MEKINFINNVFNGQKNWLDKKSRINKNFYYFFKIISIILISSIPLLTSMVKEHAYFLTIISIISFLNIVIESIISIFQFKKKWILYRNNCEKLKREKAQYDIRINKFENKSDDEAFKIFANNILNILEKDNIHWETITNKNNKE